MNSTVFGELNVFCNGVSKKIKNIVDVPTPDAEQIAVAPWNISDGVNVADVSDGVRITVSSSSTVYWRNDSVVEGHRYLARLVVKKNAGTGAVRLRHYDNTHSSVIQDTKYATILINGEFVEIETTFTMPPGCHSYLCEIATLTSDDTDITFNRLWIGDLDA